MGTSTYSSEMVALCIVSEKMVDLHYKLRMFSIPIKGYVNIFCDNEVVYKNTSISDLTLMTIQWLIIGLESVP